MTEEMKIAMQEKLKQLGIPFESINVFGAIRINVHVKCLSAATAHKWAVALNSVFKDKVTINKTMWPIAKRSATFPDKRMHKGFLISIAA